MRLYLVRLCVVWLMCVRRFALQLLNSEHHHSAMIYAYVWLKRDRFARIYSINLNSFDLAFGSLFLYSICFFSVLFIHCIRILLYSHRFAISFRSFRWHEYWHCFVYSFTTFKSCLCFSLFRSFLIQSVFVFHFSFFRAVCWSWKFVLKILCSDLGITYFNSLKRKKRNQLRNDHAYCWMYGGHSTNKNHTFSDCTLCKVCATFDQYILSKSASIRSEWASKIFAQSISNESVGKNSANWNLKENSV